jgi:arylsulfatase
MWSANVNPSYAFSDLPVYSQDKVVKTLNDDQSNLTKELTEKSVNFIEKNSDTPFFLMLAHPQPHVPLFVSDEFAGKSGAGLYGDVMMEIDWSTGELLNTLRQQALLENTLFIYMSDNGPWLSYGKHSGSAGLLRNGKLSNFEGGVRTPALVQWPSKLDANKVIDTPMISIDLLPTIMKLVDGKLPSKKIDGVDIWPILTEQSKAPSHEAFFFYFHQNELNAVRYKDWKLYYPHRYNVVTTPGSDGQRGEEQWPKLEEIELYDLKSDPSETNNIASENGDIIKIINALADQKRAELGDSATGVIGSENRPLGSL